MIIVSDYTFYFYNSEWYSSIPWDSNFFNLYSKHLTSKITLCGFKKPILNINEISQLIKIDDSLYNIITVPFYTKPINFINLYQTINIIKYQLGLHEIIFLKLFYVNSVFAYLLSNKRSLIISQLVGDPEIAIQFRQDIISANLLRFAFSKVIYQLTKHILNKSDISATVSYALKQKYSTTSKIIVSNESWLTSINYFPKREIDNFDHLKILFVGRLVPLKGVKDLLSVLKILLAKGYKVDVGIVGDGIMKSELIDYVKINELQDIVKFYGWVLNSSESLIKIYRNYNIFCLPSYSEGLPLVLLEAMAAKLLVIATNVGGIPEIIKNNETGFLFEPGNCSQLISIFEIIVSSSSQYINSIISNGYKVSLENSFINSRSVIPNELAKLVK